MTDLSGEGTPAPLRHASSDRDPLVSSRLLRWLGLSIVVIIAHGIEEYLTGFQDVNPTVTIPARYFATVPNGIFGVFQLMMWLLLGILFVVLKGQKRLVLRVLMIFGVVLVTEVHHVIAAVLRQGYYPGLITALLFPLLAFGFWRELLREWRARS